MCVCGSRIVKVLRKPGLGATLTGSGFLRQKENGSLLAGEGRKKESFFLQIAGTEPVKEVRVIKNGKAWKIFKPADQSLKFEQSLAPDPLDEKEDYYFVELEQSDGNRAWSSPIWIVR